jgi:hypothetical protein
VKQSIFLSVIRLIFGSSHSFQGLMSFIAIKFH